MEKDDEVKGTGNSYTTLWRQYDPRVGRWLSLDPMKEKYPEISPFNFAYNNPLTNIDINGDVIVWKCNFIKKWFVKAELRRYTGSEVFKKIMDRLENSEFVYTIHVNKAPKSYAGGYNDHVGKVKPEVSFTEDDDGFERKTVVEEEERTPTEQLGADIYYNTRYLFKYAMGEYQGVEEFVHAAIYDINVTSTDNAYDDMLPGLLNQEFEAKVLTHMIYLQSNVTPFMTDFEYDPKLTAQSLIDHGQADVDGNFQYLFLNTVDRVGGYNGNTSTTPGAVTDTDFKLIDDVQSEPVQNEDITE